MFALLKKIFGTAQDRQIKKYFKIVGQINLIEEEYQKLSEEELLAKTAEFKARYQKGETLESLLPEAFATVKNICRRMCGSDVHVSGYDQKWDMIPYDVQLVGAVALHNGSIAEMQTGEGKTLTAAMPLYLNALTGKSVHLVTVNDYLAKRDCDWIGSIFRKLGLSTAALTNDIEPYRRKEVYAADIVYGTASEFGFDYLRDNSMASRKEEQVQRAPYFAIIDEVDSILIDEARTPLIISGPSGESRQMYDQLKEGVATLVRYQRDHCNSLASAARKLLVDLNLLQEEPTHVAKEDEEKLTEAIKKLWLVGKGTPQNKILKRVKENPDLRALLEKWETYFFSEQGKDEKKDLLAELFIIVDERANEYELTDKGIAAWSSSYQGQSGEADFIMLDLGYEYANIDDNKNLSADEKIQKKIALREEDAARKERSHNLRQMFRAHLLMEKDVDYIVAENKIVIIDENTGRPQPGRRFSDGLHQAIEAKESVAIQQETQTYATITLQNFFRSYEKIAGMTGTAMTEAGEFKEIYKLQVLEIPTYCRCRRADVNDEIYMTEREKYAAILKDIKEKYDLGRPVLIGTESVEISEKLSRILRQNQLPHTVLNAKNHAREAEIIAAAGNFGAITLATNMAGRGTDIKLTPQVYQAGGLHVIGTTRHHSRRIDRQLRGRAGRLGDPGSSKFFVSFEDSLMRLFASPRLTTMLQRFRPPEGEPISASILNRSIETAQKRIEQRNYSIRKHTLEYDDVMNRQRQEIYSFRNELLSTSEPISIANELLESVCAMKAMELFNARGKDLLAEAHEYRRFIQTSFPVLLEARHFEKEEIDAGEIEKLASSKVFDAFEAKLRQQKNMIAHMQALSGQEGAPEAALFEIVRNVMIRRIDALWQDHLLSIDHLRSDVNLSSIGQKDPLLEFKQQAFILFDDFTRLLRMDIARDLFRFEMMLPEEERVKAALRQIKLDTQRSFTDELPENAEKEEPSKETVIRDTNKVGRNDNCPCGSGKKYKKCCGDAT